jgi:GTP-binding protein
MAIKFLRSCTKPPYPRIPIGKWFAKEVVFSGRSNVGKSSLINHLTGLKDLAKVSSTPGKTEHINFFSVDDRYLLVDLPGYGFADTSKAKKAKWGVSIEQYLQSSENIGLILQLLDIRHLPSKEDIQMITWCVSFELPIVFVLTKLDKIPVTKQASAIGVLTKELEYFVDHPLVVPYTIKERPNKDRLLNLIQERIS